MNEITRSAAIEQLARDEVADLTIEDRQSMLLDWWSIDGDDPEFERLPPELQEELREHDEPQHGVGEARYDDLLVQAATHAMRGYQTAYLERRLAARQRSVRVTGEPEALHPCPVCRYLTLDRPGEYDICPVCWWEDDGSNDDSRISGPNHMSLADARAAWSTIGAISPDALAHLAPDRTERYPRGGDGVLP